MKSSFHRFLAAAAVAFLLLPLAAPARGSELDGVLVETSPGSRVLEIVVKAEDFAVREKAAGGSLYDRIQLNGDAAVVGAPGAPQLPLISLLVAAPPEGEPSLEIAPAEPRRIAGSYNLQPAPSPRPAEDPLEPGAMDILPDPAIYTAAAPYPQSHAVISGEAWIRGQRVLRIEVYPFQYIPAEGALLHHPEVRLTVHFNSSGPAEACTTCLYEAEFESGLRAQLVNYDQGLPWRLASGTEALREQIQSPETNPFLGPRFEIVVEKDGVYRLTYADLQAAGMDVDAVNPQTFRLVNHGMDVAIRVFGEGDGSFDPGDYVTFYGEKFRGEIMEARYQSTMTKENNVRNEPEFAPNNWFWQCYDSCELDSYFEMYTADNVYYLLEGGTPGPRMASVDGTPAGASVPGYYMETVRAEEEIQWFPNEWYDDAMWTWAALTDINGSLAFPATITALASVPVSATVHVELTAENHNAFGAPDHHTVLTLNGVVFDDATWDGRIRYYADGPFPRSALVNGANSMVLSMVNDTGYSTPRMHFDFYEITYPRLFQAVSNSLKFTYTTAGTWKYQVSGFTSSTVEVYNVADPFNPVRVLNPGVSGGGGNFTASFQVTHGDSAAFIAAGTGSGILAPKSIAAYNPPDFASMAEAEYVLITHANFMNATQSLAGYRAGMGYSVAVIDIDDLYHEFNDGIYHPIAIKNFLAWTYANWSKPVVYATLVGSGNWNMRNFGDGTKLYHNAPPSYMPPNLAYVDPWQGEVDSANLLATIVGDDTIPDVHIARIPVKTNAEMTTVVGKIIAYETAALSSWHGNVLFIADNIPDSAGDFIALSENIISDYVDPHPYYTPIRLYQDDGDGIPNGFDFGCKPGQPANCATMKAAIISTINNQGALIINYTGHASLNRWSGESIFLNSDVASLTNANKLPVIMSMTCLDGHWTYPNFDSLVYTLLATANKGAVATFSATGLGVATGHDYMHHGFYASLMDTGDWLMGPATTAGKINLWSIGFYQDLMHTFMVFGDPALGIRNPYNLTLTSPNANKSGAPGGSVNYTLTVKNTGLAVDSFDIAVQAGDWSATPSVATVGPLNPNQSAQFQVTVNIPPSALGNDMDVSQVTATSQADIHRKASLALTTTAQTSGLLLEPASQTKFGQPGQQLAFSLTVTNTTVTADTFTIALTGADWSASHPAQVGPVQPGAGASFQVTVTIPTGANPGESDELTVIATSQNNSQASASAGLTAVVSQANIYLPITIR